MKSSTRIGGLVALATGVALVAVGCSAPAEESPDSPDTLVIDKSFDLVTADPARMFETTGGIVLHAVYDSLLTFADGNAEEPLPSVAESWEVNDDATVYTFNLRDGIVFSDGSPLTSDDVVFSLDRVKNIQGNGSFLMAGLSVEAPDEDTVVITSEAPNTAVPAILTSATLGIVNKDVVEENGGTDAEDAIDTDTAEEYLNSASAGSGPYTIESFDTTTEVVLVANPEYWGEAPEYDRVVIRNATAETQLQDIQSGTAHVALDLGSDQLGALEGNDEIITSTSSSPTIFFLFANANVDVSDVTATDDFREAMKYGLDRDALLELAGDGASVAYGIIPNTYLGALGEDAAVERDVDRASAAVARLGGDVTVSLEYPNDISVAGINFGPVAERIAAQLAEVGITVELAPGPVATTLENYRNGTEEMGLWLWNPDYPDSADYLAFGPGEIVGLRAGWAEGSDPALESVMDQVSTETDAATRETLYQDFQKLENEASVIVPLFQPAATVVATTAVGQVDFDPVFQLDIAAIGK
ncbi:ABC transporter substrate-binding protein [Homoserinibacter sp. GY 40078]|uniref:ABC transporter substrate-binding protein n=1 Tax=Homoserinibacter sp. GY 40078 TaxID=2603275 RepID=UPI00164F9B9E|nr:ABC transporter substrate-binding protein [Homoserinibacter sp. GY 40078]